MALCGGNDRLLWPRPTGDVILGDESITLHLDQIELVTIGTNDQDVKNLIEHAKNVFIGKDIINKLFVSHKLGPWKILFIFYFYFFYH